MEVSPQNILQFKIKEAYEEWVEVAKEEIDNDYGDAMQSMERAEATGYLNGLEVAYTLIFGEVYEYLQNFDPNTYNEEVNG